MAEQYAKVTQFKTLDAFRDYLKQQNIEINLADLPSPGESALAKPVKACQSKRQDCGKPLGNFADGRLGLHR